MWITIGVSAALLVLCCGGGIFGFGALIYSQSRALPAEATTVVRNYLEGLRDGDYHKAYDQLCGDFHDQLSFSDFATREMHKPQITYYSINSGQVSGSEVIVDAQVQTSGGDSQQRQYHLIEDQQAGGLRICGGG